LNADEKKGEATFSRSLQSHLANLHLLLRSASFSRWPLKVCFFSEDVYRHWRLWSERVDGILPDNIGVSLDTGASSDPSAWRTANNANSSSVYQLDISYGNVKEHLEKSLLMLEQSENIDCGVCKKPTLLTEDLVVICPQRDCRCCSHIACLSERFLQDARTPNQFVPVDGSCPACKATIQWAPLAKELSLRICPEGEIKAILKTKKKQLRCPENRSEGRRKEKIDRAGSSKALQEHRPLVIDFAVDAHLGPVGEGYRDYGYGEYEQDDVPLDDSWINAVTLGSDAEDVNKPQLAAQRTQSRVEIVIEDSEWDDSDIVD
jgi:structure-specific endonuclease subunit SLX1